MLNISVIVNTVAVIIGSLLGLFGGKLLKERYRKVFFQVIGLLTMGLGISMFLDTNSVLVVLGSLIVGGAIGEFFDIEEKIGRLVGKRSEDANFVKGFITASVLFVAGPVTVIGSLRAGLSGENELIYIKSL
ncbi:MAG: putative membrane protein, possible Na+ channel or pump, partial [Mesotoga prima]